MKKLIIFTLAAFSFVACSTKQPAYQGDVEVKIPCDEPENKSDNKTFRAWGEGYSTDMTIARNKALTLARAELATQIDATIKRTSESYASSYQTGINEEAKSRFQDLVTVLVNQQIKGSKVSCNKIMRTKEKKFRAYTVVELSIDEVVDGVYNSIPEDDKMRIDYEYEKFKETAKQEMKNMKR